MTSLRDLSAVSLAAAFLLLASALPADAQKPPSSPPPANFVLHAAPKPIPAVAFEDGQGRKRNLSEFRGKVVLLNIWATWCSPCRREMPLLDRLQSQLGGAGFEVLALSIDRAGIEPVRKFYSDTDLRNLAIYVDTSGKAPRELGTFGVPATLLIDREGRELGRLTGPAEWDAPDFVEFLKSIVARQHAGPPAIEETTGNAARSINGGKVL